MSIDAGLRLIEAERLTRYALITDNPWLYNTAFGFFEEEAKHFRGSYGIKGAVGRYKDMEIALIGYGIGASELMIVMEELFRAGVRVVVKIGYGVYTLTEKPPVRIVTGAIRLDKLGETILPIGFPAVANHDILSSVTSTFGDEGIEYEADIVLSTGYPYPHLEEESYPTWWRKIGVNLLDVDTATLYVVAYYRRMKAASIIIPALSTGEILEKGAWIAYAPRGKEASMHEKVIGALYEALYHSKEKAVLDQKTREIRRGALQKQSGG